MDCPHVFVYGTLRRDSNNKFARLLESQARFLGFASMPGRLLDLGRFPGAVASEQAGEKVYGEIYHLDGAEKLLPVLDEYEGPEFERVIVEAYIESGDKRKAWVYLYRGPRTGTWIASGDWLRR
jgi:gamma-glutamylcyclotransferase (GGCT)/AIG2-like uncharacterized protein YtfP